ncbi:plasmid replication initiation protein [Catalinimonas alkaloidigena]|uniref:replication initiation protein n=1 Tax=Catalinimonas alkaloidigena TaxID=1075417 RepID=UPI002404B57B|nr:replication initiation protein [Catalinimonas alkaloidigena]MDF9801257.1 plasmid replication initiation protein [Catalinimonas alkaloidigena]
MLVEYHNPRKLVVQHKKLINARFDMSLNELRIFVYMLLQIRKDDKEFRDIRIPCQMLQSAKKSIHYTEIKAATHELTRKSLQIEQTIKGGRKKWESIPLMSICSYTEGEGYIVACFNAKAAPYLLNLSENFKAVEYQRWNNLNSVYSYRFFWFLVQFEDSGYFEVRVDELKEMLHLEKKYKLYSNFKNRVLIPVQEDLEKNNYPFTFREDKCGTRKVVKLKFFFGKKIGFNKKEKAKRIPKSQLKNGQQIINLDSGIHSVTHVSRRKEKTTNLDQLSKWMLQLGFSIAEVSHYKEKIEHKELRKSVYGLQANYVGSERSLLEVYKISKECLDNLLENEEKSSETKSQEH